MTAVMEPDVFTAAVRIEPIDETRWRDQSGQFKDHNYRHLWHYGQACARRVGAFSTHVAIVQGNKTIGLADVRIKRLPVLGYGMAYINGGPLVRHGDDHDAEHLKAGLQALVAEYVQRRGLVLRINPPLGGVAWNETQSNAFTEAGFGRVQNARAYRTFVVDLDRPAEQIRKSFGHQWKTNLNHAERGQTTIQEGNGPELFRVFCSLYDQLLDRKDFTVDQDAAFFAEVQEQCPETDRFHLTIARVGGRPVAGYVHSILGDTCVALLGASNPEGLANRASYRLQWHMTQKVRDLGCRLYDLGGIDPEENPGVYQFKKGMGGLDVTVPGPFERIPRGLKGTLALEAERLYRWARKWKKRKEQ